MSKAVIAFGSNLGDRLQTLRSAAQAIASLPNTRWLDGSSVYESIAVGPEQPDYLNAVAVVDTDLSPAVLLSELHRIEAEHGRVRVQHWGPRTLDLDLVDFAGVRSDRVELRIPHPLAAERSFVLTPLAEVAPAWELSGQSATELAAGCVQGGLLKVADPGWWE